MYAGGVWAEHREDVRMKDHVGSLNMIEGSM